MELSLDDLLSGLQEAQQKKSKVEAAAATTAAFRLATWACLCCSGVRHPSLGTATDGETQGR